MSYGHNYFRTIEPIIAHPESKSQAWHKIFQYVPERFSNLHLLNVQDFSFLIHLFKKRKLTVNEPFRFRCTDIHPDIPRMFLELRNNSHKVLKELERLEHEKWHRVKDSVPTDDIEFAAWFLWAASYSVSNLVTFDLNNKSRPNLYLFSRHYDLSAEKKFQEFSDFLKLFWIEPEIEVVLNDLKYTTSHDFVVFDFSLYDCLFGKNYTASNTLKYYYPTSKTLIKKVLAALEEASNNNTKILIIGNKFTPSELLTSIKGMRKFPLIIEGNKFAGRDCRLVPEQIKECCVWTNYRIRKMEINSHDRIIPKQSR